MLLRVVERWHLSVSDYKKAYLNSNKQTVLNIVSVIYAQKHSSFEFIA